VPYGEADAAYFFGREPDRRIITANLYASRLTILYGASGVGKSSVLRAAVAHHLHEEPRCAAVVFSAWHAAPLLNLQQAILDEVRRVVPDAAGAALPGDAGGLSLVDLIERCAGGLSGPLVVILDQFEEFFLYAAGDDSPASFAAQFARAVNKSDCPATFLISIREDALARLDRFERRIPALFDSYIRIDHLDAAAARDAIVRPLDVFNATAPPEQHMAVEDALVAAVIEQVKTGRVFIGGGGRGRLPGGDDGPEHGVRVVAPYLQLVLTRLWREEVRRGSHLLRAATLTALGGAERIVRTHLDEVMAHLRPNQQEDAAQIFSFLVTPSGTKIALTTGDLASYAGVPVRRIQAVAAVLARPDLRVLRPVTPALGESDDTRYEIFHDVLAPAILDWRARYFSRIGYSRQLLLTALIAGAAIVITQTLPGVPLLVLAVTRGAGLVLINTLPVAQVYRWFARSVGFAAPSLSLALYGGPNLGILLGVLLTGLWYVSTRWPPGADPNYPLGSITPAQYAVYLITVMPTVLIGFLTCVLMRSGGLLTYRAFRRFDLGFYGVYFAACALIATLIVLWILGLLPKEAQITF
jgi:hypothetical protein